MDKFTSLMQEVMDLKGNIDNFEKIRFEKSEHFYERNRLRQYSF